MRLLIEAGNAAIAVEDGIIIEPSGHFDTVIRAPSGEVRPGLINSHDHLHRNHYGRLGAPPYANAYDWARDIQAQYAGIIAAGRTMPRRTALLHGAWKNLLSGVTQVVHHDVWEGDFEKHFPITVIRVANADSLGMAPGLAPQGGRFALHVAEGVDVAAAQEVPTLAAWGFLTPDLIAVHAVGADAQGVSALRGSGCALVWCPTSNRFLFGRTAPQVLLAEGMDVLLGTDSLLTGAGTLLDELHAARGMMGDARLLDAVGRTAARRLGLADPALRPGSPADLAVFRRPLPDAALEDVMLVMATGQLRVLDAELVPQLGISGGRILEWRGTQRWISD